MDKQLVISVKTILVTLGLILSGYVVYKLFDTIVLLIVALLLVIAMEGPINFFRSRKLFGLNLSRPFSVVISYLLLILSLVLFSTLVFPPVFVQVQKLVLTLPEILSSIPLPKGFNLSIENILPQISQVGDNLINITLVIFSNVTSFLTVFMLSIYMSLDWENLKKKFSEAAGKKHGEFVKRTMEEVETTVGNWIKGQLVLMVSIGGFSFLGLYLLDVDYPLALGLISGVLEFIPVIGPVLSAIVAAIVAFTQDPLKGIAVLILFFIIQQLENNLLVPRVMGKVSGYGPLAILFVLMVSSNFFGLIGAILGVPVFMILMILIKKALSFEAQRE